MKNILIGGAWPYANGSLHIGHIAGLLPGDVLARYHRAAEDNVYFVSGSDCHGTPVGIRAKKEGKSPREISDFYHEEFKESFKKLGFSYDVYTKTSSEEHKDFVRDFHKKLYQGKYVYEKEVPQAYCRTCRTFLADRFVTGKCPVCREFTRGDQCDACGAVLEPETLTNPCCALCESPIRLPELPMKPPAKTACTNACKSLPTLRFCSIPSCPFPLKKCADGLISALHGRENLSLLVTVSRRQKFCSGESIKKS